MTTEEKIARIAAVAPEFGLSAALDVLELPRSTWYYRRSGGASCEQKHAPLRAHLEQIARSHPEYGYRRATPEASERLGRAVNHKVVQKLQSLWDLALIRKVRPPRPSAVRQMIVAVGKRANLVAARERIGVLEVLYTDFTELRYRGGKAHLIVLLDHVSKVVLGWAVGPRATSQLALAAWEKARRTLRRHRRSTRGVIVHQDQDPVFTGYAWTGRLLLRDHARVSYALRGAKDNPEMESFYGRFKTENASLLEEAEDLRALRAAVGQRMRYYNHRRRHSTIGNVPPWTYLTTRRARGSQ
ncbi:MAG: IS3 family transposase [Planctomycetes bacterium]|nr:IS3 family transposase [Planctomycetota bacterium]